MRKRNTRVCDKKTAQLRREKKKQQQQRQSNVESEKATTTTEAYIDQLDVVYGEQYIHLHTRTAIVKSICACAVRAVCSHYHFPHNNAASAISAHNEREREYLDVYTIYIHVKILYIR